MAEARIFADLKADHDQQRKLLAQIADTHGASDERRLLFETLMLDLSAHAAAEEESLYAHMMANPELREDARHSVSEHKEVDDLLGALRELDQSSSAWLPKFKEMRHRYEHHIDEEEADMFPAAGREMSRDETERLGRYFEERKPQELDRARQSPPGSDERE